MIFNAQYQKRLECFKSFLGIFFSQDLVLSSNQLIFGWTKATTGSPVISWLKFVAQGYQ